MTTDTAVRALPTGPQHVDAHELAVMQPHQIAPAAPTDFSPRTLDEALRLCDMLAKSEMVPKDYQGKPANILVAIQAGAEIGLKPVQSMWNIAVINGRPSLWGDAQLALVRSSPHCEYVDETFDEQGTAVCRAKRRGEPREHVVTFSVEDQKTAGLLGKTGPHTQYPKRMRQLRARGFALRDKFTDVLKGIPQTEELLTIPPAAETVAELPRNATAVQIATVAAPKVERTERHTKLIGELETLASESGFQTFKDAWAAMPKEDRAAIGIAERDRIGAIGHTVDEKAGVVHPDGAPGHD